MARSRLILTDSGGVQEEAPSLNVPVLVMRETTERPEGVDSGCAKIVGTNSESIIAATKELLEDADAYDAMARAVNPYGDGTAARQIVDIIANNIKPRAV
jgi:UDP-N-acetylglucosamine 2-epimerase (non-hydrolysing)